MASDPHPSDITPVSLTMPQEVLELAAEQDKTLLLDSVESLSVSLPSGESPISGARPKPPPRPSEQTSIRVDEAMQTVIAPASDAVTLDAEESDVEAPARGSVGTMIGTAIAVLLVFGVCFVLSALAVIALVG